MNILMCWLLYTTLPLIVNRTGKHKHFPLEKVGTSNLFGGKFHGRNKDKGDAQRLRQRVAVIFEHPQQIWCMSKIHTVSYSN